MKSIFFVTKKIEKKEINNEKENIPPIIQKQQVFFSKHKPFNYLVLSTEIILSIQNGYVTLYEPIRPKSFMTHSFYLILSEIKEKYRNKRMDLIKISELAPKSPIPFTEKKLEKKNTNFNLNNDAINVIDEDTDDIINLTDKFSDSKNSTGDKNLSIKRKRNNDNIDKINKKKIFCVGNDQKLFKQKKIKSIGRKKKNSGEIGEHNKFSNDNMMRKLKNKVIESARKLISKKIIDESDSKFPVLHKICGEFSQELNIKFNYWFHLQKFKDIFQLKCSPKFKKNTPDINKKLIKMIYSKEFSNKFPLTIKLLEMTYCQYFHEIFLAENSNWINSYKIPLEENYYEINYFLNSIRISSEYNSSEDELYIKKFIQLAHNYETFFLMKNPRKFLKNHKGVYNKKSEEVKNILYNPDILNKTYKEMKFQFLNASVKYRPNLIDLNLD